MARGIVQQSKKLKWKETDNVTICGGAASQIAPLIQATYNKSRVVNPKLKREYDTLTLQPIYANAVGFYNLGREIYK